MNKEDLKKLSKSQLIKMLMEREKKKPKVVIVDDTKPTRPTPRTYKSRPPVPTPRNKVNQLVQFFENKPTPPPRTGKWENLKPKPIPRKSVTLQQPKRDKPKKTTRPPPQPPTIGDKSKPIIKRLIKALNGCVKLYYVDIQYGYDVLKHFMNTRPQTDLLLENLLKKMKGFKFFETLIVTFIKESVSNPLIILALLMTLKQHISIVKLRLLLMMPI